jgi:hypothetical protein
MKLPSKVKVGWCDYEIVDWNHHDAIGARRRGEQCDVSKQIRVDTHLGNQAAIAETLLHEILHAIYCIFTIGQQDDDERITQITSHGLATVIRDNPDVFAWIAENIQK